MTEPPEFKDATPEMRYVITQVSKIEDAQACSTGYYKTLGKVLTRLDKTDVILNQLKQSTNVLVKVTDSNAIATCVGKKTDEIHATIETGLGHIAESNAAAIDRHLSLIESGAGRSVAAASEAVELTRRTQNDIHEQMGITIQKLDTLVKNVDVRLMPPMWQIWLYAVLTFIFGVFLGKFIF